MEVAVENGKVNVRRSALLRTARKLMSGEVFIPGSIWSGR
jgi:4-oxalomesaconate tautomerase